MAKILTREDTLKAIELHHEGYTWESIANSYYTSRKTLWRTIKLYGLQEPAKRNQKYLGGKKNA